VIVLFRYTKSSHLHWACVNQFHRPRVDHCAGPQATPKRTASSTLGRDYGFMRICEWISLDSILNTLKLRTKEGVTLVCQFNFECPVNMQVASPSICRGNLSSPLVLPLQRPCMPHKLSIVLQQFLCKNLCDFWMSFTRFCVCTLFSRRRCIVQETLREMYCIAH